MTGRTGELAGVACKRVISDRLRAVGSMGRRLARCGTLRQVSDGQCSAFSGQPRDHVVALVLPGVLTFELGCAVQVFAGAPGPAAVPGEVWSSPVN